jgi:DNA-binding CsgD family transcriptional regulator
MTAAILENSGYYEWLAWLPEPTILVNKDCELLGQNESGRARLEIGFPLRLVRNRISGASPNLDRQIRHAIQKRARLSILEFHAATRQFVALWGSARGDHFCLRMTAPNQEGTLFSSVELGDSFNLTGAERRILSMIFANLSAAQIAAGLGLSVETIRTHRKRIYAKVGVNGRADMLTLFARAYVL